MKYFGESSKIAAISLPKITKWPYTQTWIILKDELNWWIRDFIIRIRGKKELQKGLEFIKGVL